MTTTITIRQAADVMKRMLEERGAFVYTEEVCRYANPDGTPSCAVGVIAQDVLPVDEWDTITARYNEAGVTSLVEAGAIDTESVEETRALEFLQRAQDSSWPWPDAASVLFALDEGDLDRVIGYRAADGVKGENLPRVSVTLDAGHAITKWETPQDVTVRDIVTGVVDPFIAPRPSSVR